jgi:hypothetical protein
LNSIKGGTLDTNDTISNDLSNDTISNNKEIVNNIEVAEPEFVFDPNY